MKALTTLIALSIAITTAAFAAWAQLPAPEPAVVALPVEQTADEVLDSYGIYGADTDQEAAIVAAMDRFSDAGLSLPPLRIYVHDSPAPCHGHMGVYSLGGDKHRVDICVAHPAVIRHELAHAWEHHNMDDATRRLFQRRVGITEWNDQDASFRVRGIEQAAYLIAWGLDNSPIQFMARTRHHDDLENFELLTGRPSPRVSHWGDAPAVAGPTSAVVTNLPAAAIESNSRQS